MRKDRRHKTSSLRTKRMGEAPNEAAESVNALRSCSLYQSELASFKAKETPDSVLLLDAGLWRFLIAWKNLSLSRKRRLSIPVGRDEKSMWQWLWENASFSVDELALLAGACVKETEEKLKMLSGVRMVYPDGTLNSYVEKLLKARVVMLFKKAQLPRTKASPKEEGKTV